MSSDNDDDDDDDGSISNRYKKYLKDLWETFDCLLFVTVVGVDKDGISMTVPKRGAWNLLEVVESMLNGELILYIIT